MKPFLQQVAHLFYQEKKANIEQTIFVFPSRRASVFFQQYLLEMAEDTFFAPACYTISDFFCLLTPGYESEDKLGLLFRLYRHFKRITGSNETFDSFMSFGEILLKDFNDIDNYLVNAKHIFTNLADLKQLDDTSYLTQEQKEALEKYLGFISRSDKDFQSKTGEIWSKLYQLYKEFSDELLAEKLTYDGLQHRLACEQPTLLLPACDEVVFVGFNALDGATKHLFERLKAENKADFYWDYQSDYINDTNNKAHYFMQENLTRFPSKHPLSLAPLPETHIHLVSAPSAIGQTKYVAQLLKDEQQKSTSTAVVLANEQLLMPMLYAMPEEEAVNITMGYPLKQTSVRKLIDDYLMLQVTSNEDGFYHTHVEAILNHPYIKKMYSTTLQDLPSKVHQQLRILPELLQVSDDFSIIFAQVGSKEWLSQVEILLCKLTDINDIDKKLVEEARLILVRLQGLLQANSDIELKPTTLMQLIRKLLMNVTLSFIGEPIQGIQMMGMLETRCLDFNRLIITSFNEGIYPKKDSINTYIPYSIRGIFGMPTTEHQDAVYAYNFYRLIQRASHVYMLYDTRTDSSGTTGEVSRFAKQLQYAYRHPFIYKTSVNCATTIQQIPPITIKHKEELYSKVVDFLTNNGLSASALNNFIACPLKFYLANIEKINFNEAISEELQSNQFGSIYHYVMEHIYKPYTEKEVLASDIEQWIKDEQQQIDQLLERGFAHTMYNLGKNDKVEDYLPYPLKGIQLLTSEIIKDYVIASLKQDKERAPFKYIAGEKPLNYSIQIPNIETNIKLKGFADRIEFKNNYIQVYDYKTSSRTQVKQLTQAEDIRLLFASDKLDGKDKLVQLCFYYLLSENEFKTDNIKVHLYFVKNVFDDPLLFNSTTERVLPDGWKDVFIEELKQCIGRMLPIDDMVTVAEEGSDACNFCNFKSICGR